MNLFYDPLKLEAGVDECARGVLFGRIYAAAVIFPKNEVDNEYEKMINDSKKLNKSKRCKLYEYIKSRAIEYSICWMDEKEVDDKGIQYCNMTLFHKCLDNLTKKPDIILVDGTQFNKYNNIPHLCIKKGDSKYMSIASASILAKVEHDKYIEELVSNNNELVKYDLLNNMGYGTKKHIEAIKQFGYTKYHRKSYKIKCLQKN